MAYFGMIIKEEEGNPCESVDIHLINFFKGIKLSLILDGLLKDTNIIPQGNNLQPNPHAYLF